MCFIFLTFFALFKTSGRIILTPIYDQERPWPTCKQYDLSYIFASSENLNNLTQVLKDFGLDKALISGWNGVPFDSVLYANGTLAPFDPATNKAKFAFCAKDGNGTLVEPNFNLKPRIIIGDKVKRKRSNKNKDKRCKQLYSAIMDQIRKNCAPYCDDQIDGVKMLNECCNTEDAMACD